MADNSAEIAELEEILNAGASNVSIDGTNVQYDLDQIRRRLRELKASDDNSPKRPPFVGVNLGGF